MMAGHSKFKNIQRRKESQDSKKSKLFGKILDEITNVARNNPEEKSNPKLRAVIEKAKSVNIPKEKVQRAIDNASKQADESSESIHEAFIQGVAFLIITFDSNESTLSEIKSVLKKFDSNVVSTGTALFLFEKVGEVVYNRKVSISEEKLIALIEQEILLDYKEEEKRSTFFATYTRLKECEESLCDILGAVDSAQVIYKPKNIKEVTDQKKKDIIRDAIARLSRISTIKKIYNDSYN